MPIRTNVDLSAFGPALPISERHRGRIREIAKQIVEEEEEYRQPYLTLHAGLTEGHLPVVKTNLVLRGIDCESFEPLCGLPSTEMVWDTGAHRTIITEDILSTEFRKYLATSVHDPYRSSNGLRVQVEADIALTNEILHINTVALVVPRSVIPNTKISVLFGQAHCIDRLVYRSAPRQLLRVKGEE